MEAHTHLSSEGREIPGPGAKADCASPECRADVKPLRMYQKMIHELDPTVNAAGVEANMLLQYGALDHLSREDLKVEIALARCCEAAEPGHLRRVANSYGMAAQYDNAEHYRRAPVYTACVACSGKLTVLHESILTCDRCGGVHGDDAMTAIVKLSEPMLAECQDPRYFDMTRVDGSRVHGWFDVTSGRVVQYG